MKKPTSAVALTVPLSELEKLAHCWDRALLPTNDKERELLRRRREVHLVTQFRAWIRLPGIQLTDNADSFDRYMIDVAAESFGSGILLCDYVHQRLVFWQLDSRVQKGKRVGLDKLQRFFAAIIKGDRVAAGEAKSTITAAHPAVYELLSNELTLLRERLKTRRQHRMPTFADVESIIAGDVETFDRLHLMKDDLKQFCLNSPDLAKEFIEGNLGRGPKQFAAEWMASWDGRNAKGMLDDIYRMRKT